MHKTRLRMLLHPKAQWTIVFSLLVVILAGLTILLAAIAADTFYPGGANAVLGMVLGTEQFEPTAGPSETTFAATNTPFKPLPTNTITPTPTKTPTPTATPTSTNTPEPTVTSTPEPPTLAPNTPPPSYSESANSVLIGNITGYPQSYNLSCESRSASDWSRYFGFDIGETEFLFALPSSDDPNQGFVGSVYDLPGQIPPNGYGVHADPVARLLRSYGLPAEAVYGMSADDIRNELNDGQPIIAWVITGTVPGYAVNYTTQAGDDVRVAPNEHTVIIIGYDPDGVTILDGAWTYWRSWDAFFASFGVLGNMAVIHN